MVLSRRKLEFPQPANTHVLLQPENATLNFLESLERSLCITNSRRFFAVHTIYKRKARFKITFSKLHIGGSSSHEIKMIIG